MRRRLVIAVFAAFLSLITAQNAKADVNCITTLGAVIINDNLNVLPGRSCTLNGTEITGNVTVQANARLTANQAFLDQNLYMLERSNVRLIETLIGGDFILQQATVNSCRHLDPRSYGGSCLFIDGSTIGGNVTINAFGFPNRPILRCLYVNNSSISGEFLIDSIAIANTSPDGHHSHCSSIWNAPRLGLLANSIGSDLTIQNVSVAETRPETRAFEVSANVLGGDFLFLTNGITNSLADNTVSSKLQYLCNTRAGSILRNVTGGDFVYQSTAPLPTVSGNSIGGTTSTTASCTP